MCTAVTVKVPGGSVFLGRTMDFSYELDPELSLVPRGYQWNNALNTHRIRNFYSFMGIGQNLPPVVFTDGVNEMGFGAAALYFPGYASYDTPSPDRKSPSIAAVELVHFLLGLSASVEQAAKLLRSITIVGTEDPVTQSIAPLHWIMADRTGACMVAEKMEDGLHLMDNPMGVLANSPDFKWHTTNLCNYLNVSPCQPKEAKWPPLTLTPFGQAAGTMGMPGDYTAPSRFVRTAYLKSHTSIPAGQKEAAASCFHILDSVSIPKGSVITDRNTPDYTQYTAFMDLTEKEYFFKTYYNSQIANAKLSKGSVLSSQIVSLGKLNRPPVFDSRT